MDFREVDMRIRTSEVECQLDLFLVSKEAIKGEKNYRHLRKPGAIN